MATPRSFDEAMGSEDTAEEDLYNDSARKRQRLSARQSTTSTVDNDYESANESDGPILPDDYRRSPQNRPTHQPGSIVRVKLQNFVTYTKAEFHPGPNLNMVIGPNGTGKSTLVCAICLGLGWSTSNLGRAKDISEFVKHGSQKAMIEIELARDPSAQEENPIISTRITKDGSKTEFFINGRKSSKKDVLRLASSFSIQVDNLCQFLPQDRVVEFASLSPVQLLTQTQRAAAPAYMSEWHDELKALGKDARTKDAEQQTLTESLKRLQDRQRAQQADVDRIREHSSLQERLAALQRFRPFPLYAAKKVEFLAAKERRRESTRELNRLERQLEPNLRAANEKEQYLKDIKGALSSKQRLTKRVADETSKIYQKYEERVRALAQQQAQHKQEQTNMNQTRASITKITHNIQKIQNDMKNAPPEVDFAAMNEVIRDLTRQIRSFDDDEEQREEQVTTWRAQIQQREQSIRQIERQKEHMQSQQGKQVSKLNQVSSDTARGWAWVQENKHRFQGEVYGPPMITCTIKDKSYINHVEQVLGRVGALAFTVTNKDDYNFLQDQFHGKLKIKEFWIRNMSRGLNQFGPPCSSEQLQGYGLQGWVLDLLEGPETVLAMLCDNHGIESTAYTKHTLDNRQLEALKRADNPIASWMTSKEHWQITRRREYGDQAVSQRVTAIRQASFFTDAPVNNAQEQRLDHKILELRDEIESLNGSAEQEKAKINDIRRQRQVLENSKKVKVASKNEKQAARTAFDALPTKLDGQKADLANAESKIADFHGICRTHIDKIDQLQLEKGQIALNLANSVEQCQVQHMELLAIELMEIEAASDHKQLRDRHAEEEKQLQQRRAEVAELVAASEALRTEAGQLGQQCRDIGADMSEEENTVYHEISELTVDQLELEIQSAEARLDLNTGGNRNVIKEFEQRERQIASKHTQLEEIREASEKLKADIKDIQERWEPQLQDVVDKISASFAENFASINCAGEVGLYKDEDFEQWAIQIKVKFREQEPLSLLDSHRQSGGERAVSTIFYLMALQSLARAPFRVVDEINQGMDPRNERLVHSRLVSIACQSQREDGSGGSQYFLITPKLLSGLEYHPNMKVHCIASGEWMPRDHAALDFQQLAQRALAVRAAPA